VTERPARPSRPDPRDVAELKELKAAQPELASAVDMQIALVEMQRRVQARVPLPRLNTDEAWQKTQLQAGKPLVRFEDIPLEWSDFRLTFRQTADILHRFETLERADFDAIVALGRDGNTIEPIVSTWYAKKSVEGPAGLDNVLLLALRPFLARCAEALSRVELSGLACRLCPFCAWEPEFAVVTPSAERHLICGRCAGQWPYPAIGCPFCGNDDRGKITSFATRDGKYRVSACDVCRRYLKAYDARQASRPVLVAVDTIATLPLDAAAMQKGYQ
jgi:formate dehydrogenase maturation protein FdhE